VLVPEKSLIEKMALIGANLSVCEATGPLRQAPTAPVLPLETIDQRRQPTLSMVHNLDPRSLTQCAIPAHRLNSPELQIQLIPYPRPASAPYSYGLE